MATPNFENESVVQHLVNAANEAARTGSIVQPTFEPAVYVEDKYALEVLAWNLSHGVKLCGCDVCRPLKPIDTGYSFVRLQEIKC